MASLLSRCRAPGPPAGPDPPTSSCCTPQVWRCCGPAEGEPPGSGSRSGRSHVGDREGAVSFGAPCHQLPRCGLGRAGRRRMQSAEKEGHTWRHPLPALACPLNPLLDQRLPQYGPARQMSAPTATAAAPPARQPAHLRAPLPSPCCCAPLRTTTPGCCTTPPASSLLSLTRQRCSRWWMRCSSGKAPLTLRGAAAGAGRQAGRREGCLWLPAWRRRHRPAHAAPNDAARLIPAAGPAACPSCRGCAAAGLSPRPAATHPPQGLEADPHPQHASPPRPHRRQRRA
jgi:hypothetical protein